MKTLKEGSLVQSDTDNTRFGRVAAIRVPGIGEKHVVHDVRWQDGTTSLCRRGALVIVDRDTYEWAREFYRTSSEAETDAYSPEPDTAWTLMHFA